MAIVPRDRDRSVGDWDREVLIRVGALRDLAEAILTGRLLPTPALLDAVVDLAASICRVARWADLERAA